MSDPNFVLDKIHSYYSSAFDQVLIVVGLVFTLVGVVVPAGVSYFQSRQSKRESDALKASVSSEVDAQLKVVMDRFKEDLDVSLGGMMNKFHDEFGRHKEDYSSYVEGVSDRLREEIREFGRKSMIEASDALSGVYYVQALHFESVGAFDSAAHSAAKSGVILVRSGVYRDLDIAVDLAIENYRKINKMNPEILEKGVDQKSGLMELKAEIDKLDASIGHSALSRKIGVALSEGEGE